MNRSRRGFTHLGLDVRFSIAVVYIICVAVWKSRFIVVCGGVGLYVIFNIRSSDVYCQKPQKREKGPQPLLSQINESRVRKLLIEFHGRRQFPVAQVGYVAEAHEIDLQILRHIPANTIVIVCVRRFHGISLY